MSLSGLARGIIGQDDITKAREEALRVGSRIAPEPTWHDSVIALARPVEEYILGRPDAAEFVLRLAAVERAYHNLVAESAHKGETLRTGSIDAFMASAYSYRDFLAGAS